MHSWATKSHIAFTSHSEMKTSARSATHCLDFTCLVVVIISRHAKMLICRFTGLDILATFDPGICRFYSFFG